MEPSTGIEPVTSSLPKTRSAPELRGHPGGGSRIRTCEGVATRFTVWPLWPLGHPPASCKYTLTAFSPVKGGGGCSIIACAGYNTLMKRTAHSHNRQPNTHKKVSRSARSLHTILQLARLFTQQNPPPTTCGHKPQLASVACRGVSRLS